MSINKATRQTLINSAVATLDSVPNIKKKENISGVSYFLGSDRICKIVSTGRIEINEQLPQEAVSKLTTLGFQDWSQKPRSGVKYYGLADALAIELTISAVASRAADVPSVQEAVEATVENELQEIVETEVLAEPEAPEAEAEVVAQEVIESLKPAVAKTKAKAKAQAKAKPKAKAAK